MARPIFTFRSRARSVVLWAVVCCAATQLAIMCLPGYPWPARTEPEVAVRTERFNRDGGWLREKPTLEESVIQWQLFHLLTAVTPQDVVFVGDSSCLMGIMPRRITQQTQLEAWNLGTMASLSTEGHAEILELYLNRHRAAKPRLVVGYFTPKTLGRTREEVEDLGVFDQFQEWLHGADAGQAAQAPLAQFPGYRLRRPLHATANRLMGNGDAVVVEAKRDNFATDAGIRQELFETHGYLMEQRKKPLPPRDPVADAQIPTPEGLAGVVRMFAMTRAQSVDLLVMLCPAPESHRCHENDAMYRRLENELRTAARPYPNVTIQPSLLRYYPDQSFGSPNHLTEAGALRNSDEITQVVNNLVSKQPSPDGTPVKRGPASLASPDASSVRRR